MTSAHELAAEAFEHCGPTLTREQFGVFAWCAADLEARAWAIYASMLKH